jgi:hypothetical protein
MEFLKWAAILVVAFLAFRWLRSGIGASASLFPQSPYQPPYNPGPVFNPGALPAYFTPGYGYGPQAWQAQIPRSIGFDYGGPNDFSVSTQF